MKPEKTSTAKLLRWLDENLLTYLAGFLLVFIPLYPKLPLFDIIPGYIVRVRLEDFFIGLTLLVWVVQAFRGKVPWKNPLLKIVAAYALFGFLTTLSAMFITKTVPVEILHVGKMYLHYLRYLQYFSLLFIFFAAVKNQTIAKAYLLITTLTLFTVSIYGYGQKYLYWPVYSTMNREFAKGWRLYLTEHARVPSTFGGHYDLAAYTMIVLTIILALFYFTKHRWLKIVYAVTYAAGFWLLILTASRTSFIAYLVSITSLLFILAFLKGVWWATWRWVVIMTLSMGVMLSFGDLSARFSQVIGLDKYKDKLTNLAFLPKIEKPQNAISIEEAESEIAKVTVPSDTPPSKTKPTPLPGDVYEDIPLPVDDGQGGVKLVTRTYSDNAYKYGLSAAIRLDALWPRAIAGFKANPLLGAGYATLTKEAVNQFTEAESTDNNFLRTLGETGILGFVTFYGAVFMAAYLSLKKLKDVSDPDLKAFVVGMVAAIIGLLINATYIDIFAASKVAESFWALVGLLLAVVYGFHQTTPAKKTTKAKK